VVWFADEEGGEIPAMSWDDYTRAVLRLDLPEGEMEVVPAMFGRTAGVFPGNGRPFHIITSAIPGDRLFSADVDSGAFSQLVARVADTVPKHYAAVCGDRSWEHVQLGVVVVGLDREQARALGCELGQEAIFEWSSGGLAVLSCIDARVHYTGWVSSPVADSSAAESLEDRPAAPHVPPAGQVAWADKIERERVERVAVDEEYYRQLGNRTGLLFELRDERSDEFSIAVFGTGSTLEVRQTDHCAQVIVDIAKQLPAVLRSRLSDDSVVVFDSGEWDAGDVAYTLGGTFDPLSIDEVEWSGSCSDHPRVALPLLHEAPSSCLVATILWEWVDGGSFSPMSSESGTVELLKIGPIFVAQGDEWSHVLKARTKEAALAEFKNNSPDEEGLEQSFFVESPGQE
jgi:hypothetical protein